MYSDAPVRNSRRPITTSSNSVGSQSASLSKVSRTSAIAVRRRDSEPPKITSSARRIRSSRGACSPIAQRMASDRLLLPAPFGPTMAVTPGRNSSVVRRGKVLNPCRSIRRRYIRRPLGIENRRQRRTRRRLLRPLLA